MKTLLLIAFICVGLAACGGGSSSSSPDSNGNETETGANQAGVFLDSAVVDIGYKTETLEGVTNSSGEFEYVTGENVTFFIGDLELPLTAAKGVVTPLDIASSQDTTNPVVVNIIRLLQTLDDDGDATNGITIGEDAKNAATQEVDFELPINDFATSTAVTNLVANSGSSNTALISQNAAIAHFEDTLIEEDLEFSTKNTFTLTAFETIVPRSSSTPSKNYSITASFSANSQGACKLTSEEGWSSSTCSFDSSGNITLDIPDMVGTVTSNSVTIIGYPRVGSNGPDDSDKEDIVVSFYGSNTPASDELLVTAGTYTLSGIELIAQNDENLEGASKTDLSGTFTVNSDASCAFSTNEGSGECEIIGNSIQGINGAEPVKGTITNDKLTMIYNSPGDELVIGSIEGERD